MYYQHQLNGISKMSFKASLLPNVFRIFLITVWLLLTTCSTNTAVAELGKTSCEKGSCCYNDPSAEGCNMMPANTKLVLVQVIFRHGDRTPLFSYPSDPLRKENSSIARLFKRRGMLTKRGKVQAYELGMFLRDRYKEYLNGIMIPEEVYVLSSSVERSIMTAQTCLAGLFPPECFNESEPDGCQGRWSSEIMWQPIPVFTIPKEVDNKINFRREHCPAYEQQLYQILNCRRIRKYKEENKQVFETVKEKTCLKRVDWIELGQVYDTLFIEDLYGLQLPNWTDSVYPSPLREIEAFGFKVLSFNKVMMRLNGGPLLTDVINNMKNAATQLKPQCPMGKPKKVTRPKKLYMFSGHDTTVSAFLSTLDVFEIHQPSYTSSVMVELHHYVEDDEDEDTADKKSVAARNKFIVKVFYRNKTDEPPKEMTIPNCGNPCHLDKLEEIVGGLLLSRKEWESECELQVLSFINILSIFPKYILRKFASIFGSLFSLLFGGGNSKCGASGCNG